MKDLSRSSAPQHLKEDISSDFPLFCGWFNRTSLFTFLKAFCEPMMKKEFTVFLTKTCWDRDRGGFLGLTGAIAKDC